MLERFREWINAWLARWLDADRTTPVHAEDCDCRQCTLERNAW